MKYFCYKCGKANNFYFQKPNNCAFCKTNFSASEENVKFSNSNTCDKKVETVNEFKTLSFKKVRPVFTIDNSFTDKCETFGDLLSSNVDEEIKDNLDFDNNKYYENNVLSEDKKFKSNEDILEQFKIEAGCSRQK